MFHEEMKMNGDGDYVKVNPGYDTAGNAIGNEEYGVQNVLDQFFETPTGIRFRQEKYATYANAEFVRDRATLLYPDGFNTPMFEKLVASLMAVGDIVPAPEEEQIPAPLTQAEEFDAWANALTTTTQMRLDRQNNDPAFAAWYRGVKRGQLDPQGLATTTRGESADYSQPVLMEFANAFKAAPSSSSMKSVSGHRRIAGFRGGAPVADAEFEALVGMATNAHLL